MRIITSKDLEEGISKGQKEDISFTVASVKLSASIREFIVYHHSEGEDDISTQKMAYEIEFYVGAILNRFAHSASLCTELFDILWSIDDDAASEFLLCCLGSEDVEVGACRILMWLLFEHGESDGKKEDEREEATENSEESPETESQEHTETEKLSENKEHEHTD